MKINQRLLIALAWTLPWASANATIFTASTTINGGDTVSDGQDIVVSNCTLTAAPTIAWKSPMHGRSGGI